MSMSRSDQMASGGYGSHHTATQNRSRSPSANNASAPDTSVPPTRSPFGLPGGINHNGIMAGNSRSGAGSPSHDMAGSTRLFSKRFVRTAPPRHPIYIHQTLLLIKLFTRAREIQAQEGIPGLPINPWGGPPTSGNSTPLRENIPESPTDGFPDFGQLPTPDSLPQTRRARAGTVPSRFSPGGPANGLLNIPGLAAKSARVTPSQSPFNKSPSPNLDHPDNTSGGSALLSRLRAGSMPQRSPFSALPGAASPFGPSIFNNTGWNPAGVGRERGSTLASIASVGSNGPSSPSQSQYSREGGGESDVHMRTLDYLGLAETPQPPRAQLATPYMANFEYTKQSSRFRSYSVNNKDKYADDEDDYDVDDMPMENQYAAALQDQLAATHAAIHNHNLAVQAFANQASATRPRARTAGVLETPGGRLMRTYLTGNSIVPSPMVTSEMHLQDEKEYDDLPQAIAGMNIGRSNSRNAGLLSADEQGLEGPTSALWLGGIPTSTTTSTLVEMFKAHGPILSARVLTHKNCGFVNFERVESAISAKANMNGKEIFPGAGPVRINFAKPPSASNTPGHDGAFPSPSPDPFAKGKGPAQGPASPPGEGPQAPALGQATPTVPSLRDMTADILDIVGQFGAPEDDKLKISRSVQSAIQYSAFVEEIPAVREPTHTRVHDAPRLRDIRKRIDNNLLSPADIESIAMEMLPEIAELSSDYLGNTVVQKLFEHCADPVRDAMLAEIAPHLAEIGIHKNGTWAAQKIIDVCKTPSQMSVIAEHIRPYTVPLFLDQYGNYVVQGCLKFGAPFNEFIFETMLSRMWEVAQGRFGARAMRACLESHHATKTQQRMLAAAIALHSVQLATDANGALLLTWFLDTCTFPQRRTVLSPRLVPYLVHLCTHKVAYLTVLKVINQKAEADARDAILKALFLAPNNQVLEAILSDHAYGATLIFKVLTTPFFDESIRGQVVDNVKNVLVKIKAQPGQGYKRLMDEVGLSTRAAGPNREPSTHSEQRQRPTSRQNNMNGHHSQQGQGSKSFYNPLNPAANAPGFDAGYGSQRSDSADPGMSGFQPYSQGMMYNAQAGPAPPVNLQQMQYQQNMMGRATPQMNYSFPPMQPGYGAYGTLSPSADQYRQQNMPNGSPIQPPSSQVPQMPGGQPSYGPPGFGLPMGGTYGYGNMGNMGNMSGMQNMGYMQQDQGNARRGRR
ncbi:Pumilio domain-containing protein P35G2.14 [Tolypocladium paradoxum]|uniref:Pumilio domain-containing protein P35G2.14 n=1 Tax=Tolypocladium paradoxum TaxID=94208 RepID=A0A2S4L653_9HYPO|nr:Pumilio domain-containing protein P35G2.14 [Tolypocladium paradoxum]